MTLTTRPTTPLQHDPDAERPLIAGPASPEAPFPVYLEGWVTRGFGRGSKDLGCPTANLPDSSIEPYASILATGVYYGYARVLDPCSSNGAAAAFSASSASDSDNGPTAAAQEGVHDIVWPMVMSVGWNPYYNNDKRTAEVHILHEYPHDFYAQELRVIILGFIRPEFNYASLDALIKDINTDKLVAGNSVERPAYERFRTDSFFTRRSVLEPPEVDPAAERVKPPKDGEGKL